MLPSPSETCVDWTDILARAGIPEPPGYVETVAEVTAPGYESEARRYHRLREEAAAARTAATKAAAKARKRTR